jgi:hypothetical protein
VQSGAVCSAFFRLDRRRFTARALDLGTEGLAVAERDAARGGGADVGPEQAVVECLVEEVLGAGRITGCIGISDGVEGVKGRQ